MRRLTWLLFFTTAMSACMWAIQKARAETIEIRALAVCEKGKCVMAEKDYKDLQEFIRQSRAAIEHNNQIETDVNQLMLELRGALERCRADQHKDT